MAQKLDPTDPEILDAINDVRDEKSATSWALMGYVPKTNRLKLISTGTGNVSEMLEECSDAKLHFGYLRYEMSETWKYVFVCWCGEGVPATTKGLFTGHSSDLAEYLKKNNCHFAAQISARSEADLTEAEIVKALNKTSTFIRARTANDKPQEALKNVSSKFWQQQSEKDAQHKEEVQRHLQERDQEMASSRKVTEDKLRQTADEVLSQREQERQAEAERFHQQQEERTRAQQQRLDQQRSQLQSNIEEHYTAAPHADSSAESTRYQAAPTGRRVGFPPAQGASSAPPPARPVPGGGPRRPVPPQAQPEPEPEPEVQQPEPQAEPEPEPQQQQQESSWGEEPAAAEAAPAAGSAGQQARALYDYEAAQEGDLTFHEGDIIVVADSSDPSGWWTGELNGASGTFPSNFVELIQ
eukprot:m51a1_g6435 hypothetical protein (412) ;mRNA; f:366225-367955